MKLLDLYSGAGGAAMGYHRAGFEVTGVDVAPQPRYPFAHAVADVLTLTPGYLRGFDLVHASPPCQHSTRYRRRAGHVHPCANLIPATRELLQAAGVPYVIENVEDAAPHLERPTLLCGSMFGLDVRRHRLFETSWPMMQPICRHELHAEPRFQQATNRSTPRRTVEVGVYRIPLATQRQAMGIDWMQLAELSQAIPPAYTEYLGRELMAQQQRSKAA